MIIIKPNKEKYAKCVSCYEKENLIKLEMGKSSGNRSCIYICRSCADELSEKLSRFVWNIPVSQN